MLKLKKALNIKVCIFSLVVASIFFLYGSCSIESLSDKVSGENQVATTKAYPANSFVALHGKLQVVNRQLCDKNGQPVQLKGMSTHGLQWYGNFVTSGAVSTLANDWKATVVRAAMYVDEGGYLSDRSITNKVIALANYAEANGIYCIIDWHILNPGDPNAHTSEAVAFFQAMARMFSGKDHIIYEICNEPNGSSIYWSNSIKPYANTVVSAIRAIDSSAVIIVGTAEWSQRVDEPAADPLTYSNILYALHFYAGTHTQWLRDRANAALTKIGIFVSEWGTSDASGNGGPYLSEASNWMNWCDQNKISWCNWSLCDKAETSAALLPGASVNGSWPDSQISTSGLFVRDWMRKGSTASSSSASVSSASSRASSASSTAVSSAVSSVSSRSSAASSISSSTASAQYQDINLPFSFDGAGEKWWKTSGTINYINSWNLDALEINGVSIKNQWVSGSSLPAKQDGYYYIHYKGSVGWAHVEINGTSGTSSSASSVTSSRSSVASSAVSSISSSSSSAVSSISSSRSSAISSATSSVSSVQYTEVTAPFTFDGTGEKYWKISNIPAYINSWNLDALTINDVDIKNKYVATSGLPAKKSDGYYYIYYKGSYAWSHVEIK